jgi:hypothetical protein
MLSIPGLSTNDWTSESPLGNVIVNANMRTQNEEEGQAIEVLQKVIHGLRG